MWACNFYKYVCTFDILGVLLMLSLMRREGYNNSGRDC